MCVCGEACASTARKPKEALWTVSSSVFPSLPHYWKVVLTQEIALHVIAANVLQSLGLYFPWNYEL